MTYQAFHHLSWSPEDMLRQDDEAIVAHCTERGWPHPSATPVQAPIASIRPARQNSVSENEKLGDHKPEQLKNW